MLQTPAIPRGDPVRRTRTVERTFQAMAAEVREGLLAPAASRAAVQVLLRRTGSDLFEEITRLPEYYQTRTETGIFEAHAARRSSTKSPPASWPN